MQILVPLARAAGVIARGSFVCVALALVAPVRAQSPNDAAKAEVLAVVRKLFDGMRAKDTASMHATLDTSAVLQSIGPKGPRATPIASWLKSVASSADSVKLDER